MKFLTPVFVMLGLCFGCSRPDTMTPSQFTQEFVEMLKQANSELKVVVVKDLQLRVTPKKGNEATTFLDNAYDTYKQNPAAKKEVLQKFVTACLDTVGNMREEIDSSRIIPVIKDRPWLEEMRQALLSRGAKKVPEHVFEDFCTDLVIVYAEDSPNNIRYLTPDDLEMAKIPKEKLKELACANLKRLLPKIERHGGDGFYMLVAGGNYEASLLLLDSVWNGKQMEVQGDIVVAIPTRDLLLVTGSQNSQGIEKMKQMAEKAFNGNSYRLTTKLFVYRNAKFEEFK